MANGRAARVRAGGPAIASAATTPTIEDAFESWRRYLQNGNRSEKYLDAAKFYIGDGNVKTSWKPMTQFLGGLNLERVGQIEEFHLNAWLEQQRVHQSEHGYARSVEFMKRFFRYLVEEGDLERMPLRVATPRIPESEIRIFTDAEIDRMEAIVRHENPRDQSIFMLLLDTGMRSSEVCNITVSDLRLERQQVVVTISKTKKSRTIDLTNSVPYLRKYMAIRDASRPKTDHVFVSFFSTPVVAGGNGKRDRSRRQLGKLVFSDAPLTTMGLRFLVYKWGQLAKITEARCSPHTFRHYYAISYLRNGGDVFSLKQIMGHAKIETTLRYSKMVQVDLRERQNKFSPALRFAKTRYTKAKGAE